MKTSESIKNIAAALLAAQQEMPHPKKKSSNPHLRNKFADLTEVMDATKPHLHANGLVVFQTLGSMIVGDQAYSTCTTRLVHSESGEWFEDEQFLPLVAQKGLNYPQVGGINGTYMKRYGWSAVCGINAEPDDDGNEAKDGGSSSTASDFDL